MQNTILAGYALTVNLAGMHTHHRTAAESAWDKQLSKLSMGSLQIKDG